jgi:UDP-glucuronate decarboxylase
MTKSGMDAAPAADFDVAYARAPQIWRQLRGSHIFLTGGTGWLGRNLLEAICHANSQADAQISVTVLTRSPDRFAAAARHISAAPMIRLHQGDVMDFRFPSGDFSHVIHGATTSAQETSNGERPIAKFDTLAFGTRRVLEFTQKCGAQNILFTSSGVATSQPVDGIAISEDFSEAPLTTDPNTALGQGKRAAEFLCSAYGAEFGCNVTIARCFSFVGPYMPLDLHYALGNFIKDALSKHSIRVKGSGRPVRSYLYTTDLVVWLLTMLMREGAPRVYNAGSDQQISIRDLAHLVRDVLCPGLNVDVLNEPECRVGNPVCNTYVPDISRAKKELALDVWTDLPTAIQLTAENFEKNAAPSLTP